MAEATMSKQELLARLAEYGIILPPATQVTKLKAEFTRAEKQLSEDVKELDLLGQAKGLLITEVVELVNEHKRELLIEATQLGKPFNEKVPEGASVKRVKKFIEDMKEKTYEAALEGLDEMPKISETYADSPTGVRQLAGVMNKVLERLNILSAHIKKEHIKKKETKKDA